MLFDQFLEAGREPSIVRARELLASIHFQYPSITSLDYVNSHIACSSCDRAPARLSEDGHFL